MKSNQFMESALAQAKIALEKDEVPVGAVLVEDGKIIAKSYNQNILLKDPTAHAEILLLRQAALVKNSHRLDGCDLYVTLEPCPMCAAAISLAKIRRVYYGASDKKSGGVENGPKIFHSSSCHHVPETYSGFMENDVKNMMIEFFKGKR